MKTNRRFLALIACAMNYTYCMEQSLPAKPSVVPPLTEIIIRRKILNCELALRKAEDFATRKSIIDEYTEFFKKISVGMESLEEIKERVLQLGSLTEEKSHEKEFLLLKMGESIELYLAYKKNKNNDSFITPSTDPLGFYKVTSCDTSHDGKFIAALITEGIGRYFIGIYHNTGAENLDYIGSFNITENATTIRWKRSGIITTQNGIFLCGLPLLKAITSPKKLSYIPRLTKSNESRFFVNSDEPQTPSKVMKKGDPE